MLRNKTWVYLRFILLFMFHLKRSYIQKYSVYICDLYYYLGILPDSRKAILEDTELGLVLLG